MKVKNSFVITLLSFCAFFMGACSNDDKEDLFEPSVSSIPLEGEGGETTIRFSHSDWKIAGITNKDGDVKMNGDVFSLDGKTISENYLLSLDGLGRLEALWNNKGFVITRDEPTLLKINVMENSTGEDFNFAIILQSGDDMKEITVAQKKSEGYRLDKIDYFIREGDGDSLYIGKKEKLITLISRGMEVGVSPLFGLQKHAVFKSEEKDAFIWLEEDTIKVKVPISIYEGEIDYNDREKQLYTNTQTSYPFTYDNPEVKLFLPAGTTKIVTELEYRQRKVSYVLTLINNRTKEEKTIEGKWIETVPTGKYEIKTIASD